MVEFFQVIFKLELFRQPFVWFPRSSVRHRLTGLRKPEEQRPAFTDVGEYFLCFSFYIYPVLDQAKLESLKNPEFARGYLFCSMLFVAFYIVVIVNSKMITFLLSLVYRILYFLKNSICYYLFKRWSASIRETC